MTDYVPYSYRHKTMLIQRYLLLGDEDSKPDEYDLFDMSVPTFAQERIMELEQEGSAGFALWDEQRYDGLTTFRHYKNAENKRVFLCTAVTSPADANCIVAVSLSNRTKVWLNGQCLIICSAAWTTHHISAKLNKGANVFIVELYAPDEQTRLSLQVLNANFEHSDHFCAMSNLPIYKELDSPIRVNDPSFAFDKPSFRFMFITHNENRYMPEYQIDIIDSIDGYIQSLRGRINTVVTVDIDALRKRHGNSLRHIRVKCIFRESNGKERITGPNVYAWDFQDCSETILQETLTLCRETSDWAWIQAQGFVKQLKRQYEVGALFGAYTTTCQIAKLCRQVKTGQIHTKTHQAPGLHEVFIRSVLDDKMVKIKVQVPIGYSDQAACPALLSLNTGLEGNFSHAVFTDTDMQHALIFDVPGRGFTGGAYVGEAQIWEVIRWIFANYTVDQDRIYILGYSNGGYATWALAQNHPGFAAAIFPHAGYPAIRDIENISDVSTYQIVSPMDHVYAGRENLVKKRLQAHGHYTQWDIPETLHIHLRPYVYHPTIFRDMLTKRRNHWPQRIIFSTPRNRHLESYWIRMHGIQPGARHAKMVAHLVSADHIEITVRGTDGVTITIPPSLERHTFTVRINTSILTFHDYAHPTLIIRRQRGKWQAVDTEPPIDYRKGTGLLDVYMDSLRIVLPNSADEPLHRVAKAFAQPYTNGIDPNVYVDYPIFEAQTAPSLLLDHNLILLETPEHSNPYARRFADKLLVQYDADGYTYDSERVDGRYVVMQVIANPVDPRRTLLIISANDSSLLRRHILLRKVIIPTYVNDLHPLWNNEVLVFDGKRYRAALGAGDTLKVVNMN